MFHISILKKCAHDPNHEINFKDIEVNDNVTFNEGPVKILDRGIKKLRNKEFPLVKIQWKHHDEREATWELEFDMRARFPEIFTDILLSISGQNLC